MTAPAKRAANKATSTAKEKDTVTDTVVTEDSVTPDTITVTETPVSEAPVSDTPDTDSVSEDSAPENPLEGKIPSVLAGNPILAEFCKQFLEIVKEIKDYNKVVLAEKDSEWTGTKVLAKAKEVVSGDTDEVKPEIKAAFDKYEAALDAVNKARKVVIDVTAKEFGINLASIVERDKEAEAPLKGKRSRAVEIGKQLAGLASLTTDESSKAAVEEFLKNNELPAVGRDQSRNFTEGGSDSTPKYRLKIEVIKDGNVLLSEDGITKTVLKLTQPVFGYERGKALKAEDLRKAWEAAGNKPGKTVQERVEFTDNELLYVLTAK